MKRLNRLFVLLLACGILSGGGAAFAGTTDVAIKERSGKKTGREERKKMIDGLRLASTERMIKERGYRAVGVTEINRNELLSYTFDVQVRPDVLIVRASGIKDPVRETIDKYEVAETDAGWRVRIHSRGMKYLYDFTIPRNGHDCSFFRTFVKGMSEEVYKDYLDPVYGVAGFIEPLKD